jgi:hypothetical protein
MKDPRNIAVVGVSGYAGLELSKILLRHPEASSLTFYVRETNGAHCLTEIFPLLRGWGQAPVRAWSVEAITKSGAGTAFLATPHEASAEIAPKLLQAGLRVVDLSGAFRFHQKETFERWYKLPTPHAALLNEAVYGLPEFYAQEIAQARIVANPGCYATASTLAVQAGSITTSTSAKRRADWPLPPAKITSRICWPRIADGLCSPMAQSTASVMFDLPAPLGPTITLTPGENSRLTRSGNDLNPFIVIDFRYMA